MSLTLVFGIYLVSVLFCLVSQGFVLWLVARLLRIERVTYLRALLSCLLIGLVGLLIGGAMWPLYALVESGRFDTAGGVVLGTLMLVVVLMLIIHFVVAVLIVKWALRTSLGRAVIAGLTTLAVGAGVSAGARLLLKTTLTEAFIVPTGSMALTIYGAHADVTCRNCGLSYAVSMSEWVVPYGRLPREPVPVVCPNCGQADKVPVGATILPGDRILVDKTVAPKRWDLVVFRFPEDPSTNFIMRLAGLPGEKLEIVDGDIFIDDSRLRKQAGTAADMWLPVHHSAYWAKKAVPGGPRWEPADQSSRWEFETGKWTFSGIDADLEELAFSGRITDELAYNPSRDEPWHTTGPPSPLVRDVRIECRIERFAGDGNLEFRWEFGGRRVSATVSATGDVQLVASRVSAESPSEDAPQDSAQGKLSAGLSMGQVLAFAFRDGQAYLTQQGLVIASLPVEPGDIETAKESLKQPPEPCHVGIVGERCSVTFSRIVLKKDVYYRNLNQLLGARFYKKSQWGCTDHPIALGRQEYFFLGDNSAKSKDGRFWGAATSDALIGVGRWICWPASRWHEFN